MSHSWLWHFGFETDFETKNVTLCSDGQKICFITPQHWLLNLCFPEKRKTVLNIVTPHNNSGNLAGCWLSHIFCILRDFQTKQKHPYFKNLHKCSLASGHSKLIPHRWTVHKNTYAPPTGQKHRSQPVEQEARRTSKSGCNAKNNRAWQSLLS